VRGYKAIGDALGEYNKYSRKKLRGEKAIGDALG